MTNAMKRFPMTHFVTGASGLLGSALVERLLERGDRVVCLVRDWVPTSRLFLEKEKFKKAILVRGDILDLHSIRRTMFEYEVNCVFHLAAQTLVGVANGDPISTFRANIEGTWNVLEAFRTYSGAVKRPVALVLASSDKAYGDLHGESYSEDSPLHGDHPYDVSKSCADLIGQAYAKSYGLNIGITRCGNFFGPGDLNGSRLIPGTVLSVLRGEAPVLRSDGSLVRDYIFVDDGADAYICLAEGLLDGRVKPPQVAFNFSYGERRSALEVTQSILKMMESKLEPVILNQAHNEIPVQKLNSALARLHLGWEPKVGFEEGLRRTVKWYSENRETMDFPTR